MRKLIKAAAVFGAAGASLLLALILYIQYIIPEDLNVGKSEEFIINGKLSLALTGEKDLLPKIADAGGNIYGLNIRLRGHPVQEAISFTEERMVVPGGNPFGIKLHTQGVLIVGMTDIQLGAKLLNPAKEAGVKVGDILTHIDGRKLERGCDVKYMVSGGAGQSLTFTLRRGTEELELTVEPVLSEFDREYKAGIWVRDSSAGIGTMTYFDPRSGAFAGLGHAVCDVDTGAIMPMASGKIVDVNISGVNAGQSGRPGELKGAFISDTPLGELHINSEAGLFGVLTGNFISHDPMPMARKGEVQPGPAVIFSTISGNKPQSFDITIEKVNHSDISPTKNMVIKINDDGLLSATGGIVQGMSGSPIIQNGKLAGAVTHVFVNDPTRGYGIFAENMDKQLTKIENNRIAA
ncbi:MAG: SpoIVB peptidase [Defluviitaleaceae bacterium]|nr:SpoIVB peptidase [Defluviitaleaceae bacterium]